jgi:hypothetical protein
MNFAAMVHVSSHVWASIAQQGANAPMDSVYPMLVLELPVKLERSA